MLVKRANVLPFGSDALSDEIIAGLGEKLKTAIDVARKLGRNLLDRGCCQSPEKGLPTPIGRAAWIAGAVTARGEAQCVRLALLTLLEGKVNIEVPLGRRARGLGLRRTSAAHIFGSSLGDNLADYIFGLSNLRPHRHDQIGHPRPVQQASVGGPDRRRPALLASKGRATMEIASQSVRATKIWTARESRQHRVSTSTSTSGPPTCDKSDLSDESPQSVVPEPVVHDLSDSLDPLRSACRTFQSSSAAVPSTPTWLTGNALSRTAAASWRTGATRVRPSAGPLATCSACTSPPTSPHQAIGGSSL